MFQIVIKLREVSLEEVNNKAVEIRCKLDLVVLYNYSPSTSTGVLFFMWRDDINAEPLKCALQGFCSKDVEISAHSEKEPPQPELPLLKKMARLYLDPLPY